MPHILIENIKIEKGNDLTGLTFKEIERFDKSADALCQETKNDYKAIVKRDSQFLNWRYSDRPDIHYYKFGVFEKDKLLGYCILKLYNEDKILRGHFIDIFTGKNNNGCLELLIIKTLNFHLKLIIQQIMFQLSLVCYSIRSKFIQKLLHIN